MKPDVRMEAQAL